VIEFRPCVPDSVRSSQFPRVTLFGSLLSPHAKIVLLCANQLANSVFRYFLFFSKADHVSLFCIIVSGVKLCSVHRAQCSDVNCELLLIMVDLQRTTCGSKKCITVTVLLH
jgi:hypothetical protein